MEFTYTAYTNFDIGDDNVAVGLPAKAVRKVQKGDK